jgi:hypothetical protein
MSDGQLAMNTNLVSPGLFLKDSNGDLVKVGPVHVGTTAPNATPGAGGQAGNSKGEQWLDTSSSRYVFKIWDGTDWRTEDGEFVNTSGDTMTGALGIIAGTAAAPSVFFSGDPNTGIFSPGADQVAISTNGTARLHIASDGKTGLGTSSPATRLEIASFNDSGAEGNTLRFTDIDGSSVPNQQTGRIEFYTSDATQPGVQSYILGAADDFVGNGSLRFGTGLAGSAAERMRLDSTGRLGLGTISPDALLTVNGVGAFGAGAVTTPSIAATGDLNTGFWFPAADTIAASTDGSERARIDSSGRLLVGTSTAQATNEGTLTRFQIQGTDGGTAAQSVIRHSNNVGGPFINLGKSRATAAGGITIVQNNDTLGTISFLGADGTDINTVAAAISAEVDGTPGANDMPGRLVFSVTADGSASPTEALRISSNRAITVSDGGNVVLGTTTGTKIGTATTQKLGFYNATPVVQPVAVADATDAASAITQLNALLARMRTLGLIAT